MLLVNPGGPGTGAAGYLTRPEYAAQYFGKSILDRFDVVGVDPRGVAGSQAIGCALPAHDPAVDRFPADAAGVRELVAANAAFARSCRERSGPLAEHLDTVSVARDLDAVRAALGERRISFLGVSYGTVVTAREVEMGVNAFLQSPLFYPELAKALKAAQQQDGTALHRTGMHADPVAYRMYRAIICQDVPTEDAWARLPQLGRRARELAPALRGYSEFWDIVSGCVGWPVPARWRPHPWRISAELPPVLVVSGAHDVATPRSWAENVHLQVPGSALLRWDGAGHSAWQINNRCAIEATVDYLITLRLPPAATVC